MIFDPVYIDAQAVADAIATTFPGTQAGIDVPPYSLAEIDLPDLRFLDTLAQEEKGLAAVLRGLLSDDVRQLIARGVELKQFSASDLRKVLSAINAALANRDFHDAELFKKISERSWWEEDSVTKQVQNMLDRRSELNAAQLRELHWHLLHAAYPEQVKAPHPTLVGLLLWREVKYDSRTRPQSLGVAEGFMIWLKASFITGFVVASPWVFYQLWMFVAAGLYPHEKKYVYIFLPFSLLLFLAGVYLALFHVFQPVLDFLFSNNAELGIDPDPRIGEWLSFFLMLPLGFGVAFQLPLVMLFLERIGIFTVNSYLAKWKIAVLSIVVLACVLTPADPVSFMFLGIPLLALYFLGIAMCWTWPRKGGLQMA
jgi:sec-independent protein translocase protein TatC